MKSMGKDVEFAGIAERILGKIKPLPGRLAVLIANENTAVNYPVKVASKTLEKANFTGKNPPYDIGQVVYGVPKPDRTGFTFGFGEWVAMRTYVANLALSHDDYEEIPEGYELRIYGVKQPLIEAVMFQFV